MAIIEVVKFDGPPDLLVWKYPNSELGTWTQLIVNETQEALLFKGGQALDLFQAGRHTLTTQNIPFLSSLVNLPFGGKSPFSAEIWFINKLLRLDVKWGTPTPIQLQEPKYQMVVSVRAFGQFGIQIEDSRKFMLKLIGTLSEFDQTSLVKYFRGILLKHMVQLISSYLVHKKISIFDINAYLFEISDHMKDQVAPAFAEYGLRLVNFSIDSINLPEDDAVMSRIKETLAKKAEMDILGFSYAQERTFDTLEHAAKNEGRQAAFMDAGIGYGMGQAAGAAFGGTLSHMTGQMGMPPHNQTCPNCRANNATGANFCGGCGYSFKQAAAPIVSCYECRQPLPVDAKFCTHCGNPYRPCPQCKADLPPDAVSCPNCGSKLQPVCNRCGKSAQPGQKFCLECGNNLTQ
ncbi:MAG: SPFH domain-containing protein [Paenibacillaceae bacterium]|nr:SPFH domain-containing protein [Paenibacillaceae bacterium]